MAEAEEATEEKAATADPPEPDPKRTVNTAPPDGKSDDKSPEAEKEDKDEKEREASRDEATSAAGRDSWNKLTEAMENAIRAMTGGSGTTVFVGHNEIGTVGNRYGSDPTDGVRIGPVSSAVVEHVQQTFVEPRHYPVIRTVLTQHNLVVVRDRRGRGRTTSAVHLLATECRAGVRKLDPDVTIKSLRADTFEPNHGYLLESMDVAQARGLVQFQLERLSDVLRDRQSRLVVIVDQTVPVRSDQLGHFLVEDIGSVEVAQLLKSHLALKLAGGATAVAELLARPEVADFVADVAEGTPHRELVRMAALLAEVAEGKLDIATVRERHSRASGKALAEWFAEQDDTDQQAFVIALAVFHGESIDLVSAAAGALADRIKAHDVRRVSDRSRSAFGVPITKRLELARAEMIPTEVRTNYGKITIRGARFVDDTFPRRVLEHVCTQYDQVHRIIREWLLGLGTINYDQVRARAGAAAGRLGLFAFDTIYEELLYPWASSGDADARWATVTALAVLGADATMAPVVNRLLRSWLRKTNQVELRATAARALGNNEAVSVEYALRLWRKATKDTPTLLEDGLGQDAVIMENQIAVAISERFRQGDAIPEIMRALTRWSADDQPPALRGTALLAVLVMSDRLTAGDVDKENWPALVWLADQDEQYAERLAQLFCRMLETADFIWRAYGAVHDWVEAAQKDEDLRLPLARLLLRITTLAQDWPTFRSYLSDWARQDQGPRDAIRVIADHFAGEGLH